ncbi:DoxX-like protein [Mucilaginibacter frigoritolerans]|uniref:DoxX-like protein n=1 Tax=Mucilaginibacter frigoritolerans TaxID=652788 RepID=A0A562U0D5_9SPHI|nr:DoxX family membrane protein [Mucilaginibacter frigoritolerans]TWI99321.1 DoxX-like protein [Mucilaginibacter frigoritolerans]
MKNSSGVAQLFLRIAMGSIFLIVVMDRLGWLGAPGSHGVSWGDWKHFIDYTSTLLPFLNRSLANFAGLIATIAEALFGLCLIIGLKIKWVALGAAILTLCFGLSMAVFVSLNAPFSYPVFVFTGASLVLSGLNRYQWSIDNYLAGKKV